MEPDDSQKNTPPSNEPPANNPPANTPPSNEQPPNNQSAEDGKTNDAKMPENPWDEVDGDDGDKDDGDLDDAGREEYFKAAGFDGDKPKAIPLGKDGFGEAREMAVEEQRELLSVLRRSGVPADKAAGAIKALADHEAAKIAKQSEKDSQDTLRVWNASKKAFGSAFKQTLVDADRGARALFPPDLWDEIKRVPAMSFDERFLRSLAHYGRTLRNDGGGPKADGGSSKPSSMTAAQWAEQWSKSSR